MQLQNKLIMVRKGKTMKKELKNVVIYTRTTTSEQSSIELQTTIDFAKANNYNVLKVFTDNGKSVNNLKRPALQSMIEYCEVSNNVDAVIVWKLDRLVRNFADYVDVLNPSFEKNNIKLLSVIENTPKAFFDALYYFSLVEYERILLSNNSNNFLK